MRISSKYFTDVRSILGDVEPHTFFQIHGIRCVTEPHCVIVELCLCDNLPFDAIPPLLFATHSIYPRSQISCNLVIIIDAQCATSSSILSASGAICSFSSFCHNSVDRIYWVGVEASDEVLLSVNKDLTCHKIQNIFVESVSFLKDHLGGECYSTNLDGSIDVNTSQQFFLMRYCLEDLMIKTHKVTKLYMNLHDELRGYMTCSDVCSSTYEVVGKKEADLKERWRTTKENSDRFCLVNDGNRICEELLNKFPLLESCDPYLYKDAVKEAIKAFDAVMDAIRRSDTTIQKRIKALEAARIALEFIEFKKNVTISLKADLNEMERIVTVKTFNINRLSMQLEKIKKLWERFQSTLFDATARAEKIQRLFDEDFNIVELDPVMLQKEVDDFTSVLVSLRSRSDDILNLSRQAVETRRSVDKRCELISVPQTLVRDAVLVTGKYRTMGAESAHCWKHFLFAQVYDWALLCAKKSENQTEIKMLASSFPTDAVKLLKQSLKKGVFDEVVSREIESLLNDVIASMRKVSGNPLWKMEAEITLSHLCGDTAINSTEPEKKLIALDVSRKHSSNSNDEPNNDCLHGKSNPGCTQLGFEERLSLLFNSASLSSSFTSLPSSNDHSTASLISPVTDQFFCEPIFSIENSSLSRSSARVIGKELEAKKIKSLQSPPLKPDLVSAVLYSSNSSDNLLSSEGDCVRNILCDHLSNNVYGNSLPPMSNASNSQIECLKNMEGNESTRIKNISHLHQLNVYESGSCCPEPQNDIIGVSVEDNLGCARASSPAPTQYEIPISKSNNVDIEAEKGYPEEAECEEETEIRWRRNSWSSLSRAEENLSGDERAIGGAPVTQDLTDKVITCMSSNTLIKRLGQRRSVSGFPSRLPNPFLINGVARPGSARFSTTYKSRPALSRLYPLESIEQDRFSIASSYQLPSDDASFTSEIVYANLSPAHSIVDFSLRSEQIDFIRNSLNPSKTSNANFRIECTVVRDMLDSEIDYVGSLRTVVQDFVPEMSHPDLPHILRGKKTRLFGNIEKLFHFHAHTFLPQLISRLRFRPIEESLSLTVGSLFVEHALSFNLYSLYAKNKPKADALIREIGSSFFSSLKASKDLANLLVRPIERIGKYTLALQQLLNATSPSKMETMEVLQKAVSVVGCQIRHGADLLAMERIIGCDLNLKEQGTLLRNDTMFVTEKRGIYAKKRMRSVFLFTNCVVITKPRLRRDRDGRSYDELRYKGSIQMTDCGLTEMVKASKTKFELWFRKQTASFTFVLETQSSSVRDLWVDDIRSLLWKQAIKSREDSLREKANMGIDSSTASLLPLAPVSTPVILRNRDCGDGTRRPCSLISLTASSCSSSNNATLRVPSARAFGTGEVLAGDLGRVEEIDELELHNKDYSCTLPKFHAPPPPKED